MAREAVTIQEVLRSATAPLEVLGVTQALADQMARLTNQLQQLQSSGGAAAPAGSAPAAAGGGTSVGDVVRGALSTSVLHSAGLGLGLSPLIAGIARLFGGGGGSQEPPPLVKFALPEALSLRAGVSETLAGAAFAVDYGQGGLPRPVTAPTQVTVQVQAMDSRSFLDHSDDIAMAVRQAMLESSVLNDVVREA